MMFLLLHPQFLNNTNECVMRKEEERKKHKNPRCQTFPRKKKEKYFQYNFKNPKQLERSTHFFKDTTHTHIRKKERIEQRALRCRACIYNNKKK